MPQKLSDRARATSRTAPKTAAKSYAPERGSVANAFSTQLINNFGNTNFTAQLQAALAAAENSGNDKLLALKAGFETGALVKMECDPIWLGIKEAEAGGEANAELRGPVSTMRNDMRANLGFGQKMKGLQTSDKTARLGYASALLADMSADQVNPSLITANNLIAQCSDMTQARKQLDLMKGLGVTPGASTDLTLLHVAYESADQKAVTGLIKKLESSELNERETKVFAGMKVKYAAIEGSSAAE